MTTTLLYLYLYPRVPPFWEKIADVRIFLQKYHPVEAKKERDLSRKYTIITKKSSTYTQGDYSGLSYGINIYIPECHRFEKKLLM